jgi:hypothetical protein
MAAPALTAFGASGQSTTQTDIVRTIVDDARQALGGHAALEGVRGLLGFGRSARFIGPIRLVGEIDIRLALPDRYVRVDKLSVGQMSAEVATGFNGDLLIQRAKGSDGRGFGPAAPPSPSLAEAGERATLAGVRQDAALMLLGFFCTSLDLHPLNFTYGGVAESPEGRADVLELGSVNGSTARLFIDSQTHLPLLVSWMAPDLLAAARTFGAAGQAIPPDPSALLARLPSVEHRLYFGDYRAVGPVRWPFRLRRSVAGQPSEEVAFDKLIVNPATDARAFDAGR